MGDWHDVAKQCCMRAAKAAPSPQTHCCSGLQGSPLEEGGTLPRRGLVWTREQPQEGWLWGWGHGHGERAQAGLAESPGTLGRGPNRC